MFNIISNCPSCGQKLELSKTGVDLYCNNNENCASQIVGRLAYYCSRNLANISGLSEKQLQKFVDLFSINDIPDLYDLPYEEIARLDGFGYKSTKNIAKSIENSKLLKPYIFLASIGIEGIGPEIAKLICDKMEEKGYLSRSSGEV